MLIGSRRKLNIVTVSPVLSINGTPVNQVSTSKSPGLLIDANLTWGSHIKKLAKIITSGIAAELLNGSGQAICSPSNIASYLQSLDSAAFRLLQCCLGKLWHKTSRQTSKTPKSCSASSNFLKLWRKCISLGARGFFSCCLRRKLRGEAAIVMSGKKTALSRSSRWRLRRSNLAAKLNREKKLSGTQGTNASQLFQNL